MNKRLIITVILTVGVAITGIWLAFADQYTGGAGDGWSYSQSQDLQMTGPDVIFTSAEGSVGRLGQVPSGYFISDVLDTNGNSTLGVLSWIADLSAGGEIKFRIAGSDDNITWTDYLGPDGTAGTYFTSSGESIPSALDAKRYLRYKAYLTTADYTPVLDSVSIQFADDNEAKRIISDTSDNNFTIQTASIVTADVEPVSLVAGVTGTVVVSFTSINPIPADGSIEVTFPVEFDVSAVGDTASSSTMDGSLTVTVSGQVITITRSGGSEQPVASESLTLTNIKNSNTSGITGTYQIKTIRSDGNIIDEKTDVSASTIVSAATASVTLNAPDDITAGGARAAYTVTRYDEFSNLNDQGAETFYLYTTSQGQNVGFYDVVSGGSAVTSIDVADGTSESDFWYYDELMGTFTNTISEINSGAVYDVGDSSSTDFGDGTASGIAVSGSGSSAELALLAKNRCGVVYATDGIYDTPGTARGVYVSGNYAYVADDTSGLKIINISNPDLPTLTGTYGTVGNARGVYVSGDYAYVTNQIALEIIDISTPSSPTLTGRYDTSGMPVNVHVLGDYAYVADWGSGLQIVDISTPSSPSLAGTCDSTRAADVCTSGNYAYVADDTSGLQIIDISNPALPTIVGTYDTANKATCVYVSGNYAYVGDYQDDLVVIDISNPSLPSLVATVNTTGEPNSLYISGDYLYVSDYYRDVKIVDISTPSSPFVATLVKTDSNYPRGVFVANDYVYVADGTSGLRIKDMTDLTPPSIITSYDTSSNAWDVCALGDYVYVADAGHGLKIIDISTPSSPVLTGTYDTSSDAHGVYVLSDYAYVADGSNGLQIIDVSSPASPTRTGTCDTPGDAQKVYLSGNYAYVADGYSGLQVIDISDLSSPTLTGTYDTPGFARDVYVLGDYAYVADNSSSGLQIVDITDPSLPSAVGSYNINDEAHGVYASGNYAYVVFNGAGLHIIDVSTPSLPTLTGAYDTSGYGRGVYVSGNNAYVADDANGLQIIDISNPALPVLVGITETPGSARAVYIYGIYAYVADWNFGIVITDISGYSSSGTFASRIMDSASNETFSTASWNGVVPADTTLTIKARTSDDSAMSGATDWASCSELTSGQDISDATGVTDTDRYIQYYIEMATSDVTATPSLSDIAFDYSRSATGGIYDTDSLNVKHAASNKIAFTTDITTPQKAGAVFTLPAIKALDTYGNLLNNDYGASAYAETITISYALSGASDAPDDNGTDSFTTNVAFANGASTTSLSTILYRAQDTTVTPSTEAAGLTGQTTESNSITVNPETKNKVVFTQEPSATGKINYPLDTQPIVVIQDVYGNQTADTDAITLYDSSSNEVYMDASGTLSAASNPLSATDGQAEFSNLEYSLPGSIYLYAETAGIDADFSQQIALSVSSTSTVDAAATPAPDFDLVPTNDDIDHSFTVLKFKITDAGVDDTPTLIDRIKVAISGTGASAATDITWAGLYIGETQITTVTGEAIANDYITFGTLPDGDSNADLYSLADNTSEEFTVYIYMKDGKLTATEDDTYIFDVDETLIGVDSGLSSQMASDSASVTPVTGTIDVTISYIEAVTAAGNEDVELTAGIGNDIKLRGVDVNKNVDEDYIGNQTFKFSGLNQIGVYKPKTDATVFGNNKTISFTAGVSATTTLTAYAKETGTLSAQDQNHLSYETYALNVTTVAAQGDSIVLTSGNNQSGAINAVLSQEFIATVSDAYANPATGEVVEFAVDTAPNGASGQSLSQPQDDTDDDGLASVLFTLGNVAGDYLITATCGSITGSPLTYTATALEPTGLNIASGNNQVDKKVAEDLNPFVVEHTASGDIPVPNVDIDFEIISFPDGATGQSLSASSATTNSNGQATATLTLGTKIGSYVVRASVGAFSVDFTATALPETPNKIILSGPSSVAAGGVSESFSIYIKDTYDNLSGVTSATTIGASSSASATSSFYSDSLGESLLVDDSILLSIDTHSATFYYKDTLVGVPTVTVSVTSGQAGLNTDNNNSGISVIPGGIHSFKVTGSTSAMVVGGSREITVTAYDVHDNVKTNYNGDINVIFSGVAVSPSAQAPTCSDKDSNDIAVGSSTTLTFSSGVATTTLKPYKAEEVAIKATAGAVTTASDSDLEFVVRHGAHDHLKFAANLPTPQIAGSEFTLETTIDVVDIYANVCDGANGATAYAQTDKTVTWTLSGEANGPLSGTDTFTNPISFSAGHSVNTLIATLYRAQNTTITPSVVGLSGTNEASNTVVVAGGEVNKIRYTQQPSATCITTQALAQQPHVAISDAYGNDVISAEGNISLAASTTTGTFTPVANGTLSAASLSLALSSGAADFSEVTYNYPENIYIRASISGYELNNIYSSLIAFSTADEATISAGALSEPSSISSLSDNVLELTDVFDFKVTDGGTDGYATKVKQIVITQSANNTAESWTDYIQGAYITDGTTQILAIVEETMLVFGSGSSIIYSISNGSHKTFTLKVYLKPTLPAGADGKVIGFSVDADTYIVLHNLSSQFPTTSPLSTEPEVAVVATNFTVTGDATMLAGTSNTLTLTAVDANGNKDKDYTGDKALVFSGANVSTNGNNPTCTSFSGADIDFADNTIITFVDGVNSSTITMKLYKAETVSVRAGDGTLVTALADALQVTVSGGTASDLLWGTEPGTVAVANAPWKEFTVNVTDAYGNIASSDADVTISASGGTLADSATAVVAASSGVATFRNFAVTCSSYPGIVEITGESDGVTPTPASSSVTVAEKYSVTVNVNDYTSGAALTELAFDLLSDAGVTMSSEGFPMTGNSPFEFELPYGTYTLSFEKEQYMAHSTEKIAGVAADALDGTYDNDISWTVIVSSLAEATADYNVKSGITYDETTDRLTLRLWIEKRGKMILNDDVNKLGPATIEIYDDATSQWLSAISLTPPSLTNTTSGLYYKVVSNVSSGGTPALVEGKTYFASCKINYGGLDGTGRLYEGGTTFALTVSQSLKAVTEGIEIMTDDIKAEVTGVTQSVSDQAAATQAVIVAQTASTQSAIATGTAATQAAVATGTAATQAAVATGTAATQAAVASGTAANQTAITTIGSNLASSVAATEEVLAARSKLEGASSILNRQSAIRNNDTMVIRYQTNTGLAPVISVYDPTHDERIESELMTETIPGISGVYEYEVKFIWGLGEHTVVCKEETTGTLDGMNVQVISTDLEDISGSLTTATATLQGIDTDELGGLSVRVADINTYVSQMVSTIDKLSALKEKTTDLATDASDVIYKQLEVATQKLKEINEGQGIKIEKMYDLSEEQSVDTDYIKNKALEIKALVELSQDILEKTDDTPIMKSWLESDDEYAYQGEEEYEEQDHTLEQDQEQDLEEAPAQDQEQDLEEAPAQDQEQE